MAEVKGKFISLIGNFIEINKDAFININEDLIQKSIKNWNELEPEGWYDTKIFNMYLEMCIKLSPLGADCLIKVGKKVYPLIKETTGLPSNLITPLDFILYEAMGFLANHRGDDVLPRNFIRANDKDVLVEATAPGYNSKLYVGVFLGILEMFGITSGNVEQTKSTKNGDLVDEFHITW